MCSFTGDFGRQQHLGSCLLDPEDVKCISLGAIWKFSGNQGCYGLASTSGAHRACKKGLGALGLKRLEPNYYCIPTR